MTPQGNACYTRRSRLRRLRWRARRASTAATLAATTALWLAVAGPLALADSADSAEQQRASDEALFVPPVDEELAERVDRLIADLSSPLYDRRMHAANELTDIGPRAFVQLREAYRIATDLEGALQMERIVKTAYMNREVYSQHGFLGVSLGVYALTQRQRSEYKVVELPDSTPAVQFTQIIEGTAAERAGLRKYDVVIAVDGMPLRATGQELVNEFSRNIAGRKPGDKMRLTVVRPEGTQEFEVTLGTCPPERVRSVRALSERIQEVTPRFEAWWDEHFRRPRGQETAANTP